MKILHIDIETFSSAELSRCGVYRYAEAPDFEIKLFGYAIDDGPVHVVDLTAGEKIPQGVIDALTDPSVEKWAHHAEFERVCLSRFLRDLGVLPDGAYIDPWGWRCTMVLAAATNLPPSLAGAGKALGLPEQKLTEGRELIRKFCSPQKPTKANGGRTRILPEDDPGAWELFKAYCLRDVEVERKIYERLIKYDLPASEWALYELDQRINNRSIRIDAELCEQAVKMRDRAVAELTAKLVALTGLDNPSSVVQFKAWLTEQGITTASLDKEAVASMLAGDLPSDVRTALELRVKLSKSSLAKYDAMRDAVCADGRIRGTLKFYGAATTGRWAGRIVQPQNLPRTSLSDSDLDAARELVRRGDYDAIELIFGDVLDVLSQLIRTVLVPAHGQKLIVSDYSAVEARVIAWIAGERWVLDAFRAGQDIYCATASAMFGVPVERHGINAELRQRGKIASLALNYGGSVGALKAMGALDAGLSEQELEPVVEKYRAANAHTVRCWYDLEAAAIEAVKWNHATTVNGKIRFEFRSGVLFVELPSARKLAYCKPMIVTNKFGRESVSYLSSKGVRVDLYGGKLAENVTQAVARDVLAYALTNLDARGFHVVCHVHDEVIIEAPLTATVAEINDIMALVPPWAKGLPLKAEGFEAAYYKKD